MGLIVFLIVVIIIIVLCLFGKIGTLKDEKSDLQADLKESNTNNRELNTKIDSLKNEINSLKKQNKKLSEDINTRSKQFSEAVQDVADQKVYLYSEDLRNCRKEITRYQKALEHCIFKHSDLANEIPQFSDAHFEDRLITFSQALLNNDKKLTDLNKHIAERELRLAQLTSIDDNSKLISQTIRNTFRKNYNIYSFFDSITTNRLNNAINSDLSILNSQFACDMRSDNNVYHVTLTSCTCDDFIHRHKPCKHILFFAYSLGLLQFNEKEIDKYTKISVEKLNRITQEKTDLDKKIKADRSTIKLLESTVNEHKQTLGKETLDFPWIANSFCKLQECHDKYLIDQLSPHAYKAAEITSEFKKRNKELLREKLLLENLLKSYEALFPWLEDFKTVNVDEALAYVHMSSLSEDYDTTLKKWLSPEEYATLSTAEKNQLALDRYKKRNKTDWEIGIEYERYIGYIHETKGYTVKYTGALAGLNDMGRDLLVQISPNETLVIQCKRWSAEKTIHEKHIFQLFGTAFVMGINNSIIKYTPVFYTTTTLSDVARKVAKELNVTVFENFAYSEYPLIKCNIGIDESGEKEKIYHLPFDQQYDRVIIEPTQGEFYALTTVEAERAGFRHAKTHLTK